ncbi:MAG: signal peptidase I [Firmicutes bacterium]|nr:signal peptidase I [Bacillota bacterium]
MNEQDIKELEEKVDNKPRKNSFVKDLIKDILIALIIVVAITLVIKPTIVKEDSMLDTLQENNYLFINKMAYKFKDHPDRGDIIVFRSDITNPETGKPMLLIKRVIGVEGDVITFKDDQVYRNGEIVPENYLYIESPKKRNYPNGRQIRVDNDEVFVMGDHRSVSRDSRDEGVGNIQEDDIVGKAFIRLYPFNEFGLLD